MMQFYKFLKVFDGFVANKKKYYWSNPHIFKIKRISSYHVYFSFLVNAVYVYNIFKTRNN